LCNGGEQHFIPCAAQSPQPQSIQFEDAFHVGKGHLNLFAFIPGAFEAWRFGKRPDVLPNALMNITRDFPLWRVRATPILDGAGPAVFGAGAVP